MSNLIPVPAPALQPLAQSFEFDLLETELKQSFMAVFESMIRPRERSLNLSGMAHLGDDDLMASALKADGIAMVKRSSTRMQFLMKANRSRNPRRGLLFIKRYLQAIWPNIWQAEPLWLRLNDTANYPANAIPLTSSVAVADTITGDYSSTTGQPVMLYRDEASGRYPILPTARTNYIRNSSMVGAVAGTPGAAPANWLINVPGGITRQIVGTGTVNGIPYVDVRFFGTSTAITTANVYFDASTAIALGVGEEWTNSVFASLVAGSLTGIAYMSIGFRENDSAGNVVAAGLAQEIALTGTLTRFAATRKNTMPATRFTQPYLRWSYASTTTATDFTLRIGLPQLEKGAIATSPLPTTSAAATVTDYTVNDVTGIATFRADLGVPPTCIHYFLTGRVRITLPVSSDNGLGLTEIAKAFRSTLPARLMLEFKLGTQFDTPGAIQIANGAVGIMPFVAIGTLQS